MSETPPGGNTPDASFSPPSAFSVSVAVVALVACALLLPMAGLMVEANADTGSQSLLNDADDDGIVDTTDVDDDNDGIPDQLEIAADGSERDTDNDGLPDRLDLDSDNDGILDWQESGVVFQIDLAPLGTRGGRLVGDVGSNGMLDQLESPVDSGRARVTPVNSDAPMDTLADWRDLDSDNDGLGDLIEAGVLLDRDSDRDGRIDAPVGTVGADGIADSVQIVNDQSCCDYDGDGRQDAVPINSDGQGLPDYLDLDSDDDGVADLVEVGGVDADGEGRVDGFVDLVGEPDGFDDAYALAPLQATDVNGNGLADQLDSAVIGSQEPGQALADPAAGSSAGEPEPNAGPQPIGQAGGNVPLDDGSSSDLDVQTGLNAAGCSISSGSRDLVTLLGVLFSITYLAWRRTLRMQPRPQRRLQRATRPPPLPQR